MRLRLASAVVLTSSLALVLSGCSSSGGASDATPTPSAEQTASTAPSASASASASPSPTGAAPGQDPAAWAPLQITPEVNGAVVQIVKGQNIVFEPLPKAKRLEVTNSNAAAVVVDEPVGTGKDVSIPASAVGVGGARVVVWDGKPGGKNAKKLVEVVFQVVYLNGTDAPGNKAPVVVSSDMTNVSLEPGMTMVFGEVKLKGATYTSANEDIVFFPPQPETNGNPFALAVGEGTTKVNVRNKNGKVVVKLNVTVTPATQTSDASPSAKPAASATPTAAASPSPTN